MGKKEELSSLLARQEALQAEEREKAALSARIAQLQEEQKRQEVLKVELAEADRLKAMRIRLSIVERAALKTLLALQKDLLELEQARCDAGVASTILPYGFHDIAMRVIEQIKEQNPVLMGLPAPKSEYEIRLTAVKDRIEHLKQKIRMQNREYRDRDHFGFESGLRAAQIELADLQELGMLQENMS